MAPQNSATAPASEDRRAHGASDTLMFWTAIAYLALLAALLPHRGPDTAIADFPIFNGFAPYLLFTAWIVVLVESTFGYLRAPDRKQAMKRLVLVALAPAFRMVVSPRRPNTEIWLPVYGWIEVSAPSVAVMEQRTAIPIILATALIIPVLIVDFGFAAAVDNSAGLQGVLTGLTAFIWFSFALEFIVMVSLAPKKLAYCKKHWINIVIIVLPLIAFLRSLRLLSFFRTAQAGKLAKAYRLRGLVQRLLKIALAFNLIERLMALSPERYAASLEEKIGEKELELAELRQKLAKIKGDDTGG